MNDLKKAKLERFMRDDQTAQFVYEVIRDSYLSDDTNEKDIQYLAGERIAVSLLNKAWKDLNKYKIESDSSPPQLRQVGL